MFLLCPFFSISISSGLVPTLLSFFFFFIFIFSKALQNPHVGFLPSAPFFCNLSSTPWFVSLPFYCQESAARIAVFPGPRSGLEGAQDGQVAGTTRSPPRTASPVPGLQPSSALV